ncbi:MAG: hypothetical protein R3B68_08175 [Phycisphaerales bacterium]
MSRHLAMLERAGVLESSRRGREVLYRVRYDALIGAFRHLADTIEVCSLACGDDVRVGGACDCGDRCGPECAPSSFTVEDASSDAPVPNRKGNRRAR